MKRAVVALASFFVLGFAQDAFAANACVNAADKGQDLRSAGRLDDARAQFLACSKASCNRVVRADCERWVKEIDEENAQAERERERERAKAEKKEKAAAAAPVVATPSTTPTPTPTPTTRMSIAVSDASPSATPVSTFPVAPAVLGGLGVISLAAFGYFQVEGWSRYSALEDGCAKTQTCTDADIEGTRSQFVASGAALGVSVVSFGVAAILYFTRGPSSEPSRVGVRPGGAAIAF